MKKSLKFFCFVFLFLIVFFIIFSVTLSKYSNSVETKVNSKIATPVISIKSEDYHNIDVLENNTVSYNFSVKNYANTVSDVSFNYILFFEYSQENPPIILNLYKDVNGKEEKIELNREPNRKL